MGRVSNKQNPECRPLSQSGQPPAADRLEAEGHKCKQGTLWWRHLEGKKGLPFIACMPKDSFSQAIGRSPWGWSPKMKFTMGEVGCGLLELRGRKGRVIVRGFWTHGGMCSESVKEDECRGGTEQTRGWLNQIEKLTLVYGRQGNTDIIMTEVTRAVRWQTDCCDPVGKAAAEEAVVVENPGLWCDYFLYFLIFPDTAFV